MVDAVVIPCCGNSYCDDCEFFGLITTQDKLFAGLNAFINILGVTKDSYWDQSNVNTNNPEINIGVKDTRDGKIRFFCGKGKMRLLFESLTM